MDDIKDFTQADLEAAVAAVKKRRAKPAQTLEEMRAKVHEIELDLSDAGETVLATEWCLRLIEQAMVLFHPPPPSSSSWSGIGQGETKVKGNVRRHMSIYCEAASRDDVTPKIANKLAQLIEQCHKSLTSNCKHLVVVSHDRFTYGTDQWGDFDHYVCTWCGLSEIHDPENPQELGPVEGRSYLYRCNPDPEPDDQNE